MADIKDKIAKLLALAESDNENEAKQALLRARELMAKHKLRPEECQKAENVKVMRAELDINCTAMTNPWATALACCIAENYCCRAFRIHKRGGKTNTIGLVGLEEDFEICKSVLLYAYDCVMSYCKHQIKRSPGSPPEPTARSATPTATVSCTASTKPSPSRRRRTRNGALCWSSRRPSMIPCRTWAKRAASAGTARTWTPPPTGPRATTTAKPSTRSTASRPIRSGPL